MFAILAIEQGVYLDLADGAEITIEMDQPLFNDEHIPTAFSTDIEFPLTSTNISVFGFVGGLPTIPSVTTLPVEIFADGFFLFGGILEFSAFEDGLLKYTFSQNSFSQQLSKTLDDIIQKDSQSSFITPRMIYDGCQAKVLGVTGEGDDEVEIAPADKYANFDGKYSGGTASRKIPAVTVSAILSKINDGRGPHLANADAYRLFDRMAMICLYGGDFMAEKTTVLESAMEPDITYGDLLQAICTILCAAVYLEEGQVRVVCSADMFGASAPLDLSDRIAPDGYSISLEPPRNYQFGFANDEDEVVETSENASVSMVFDTYDEIYDNLPKLKYKPASVRESGDVLSLKTRGESVIPMSEYIYADVLAWEIGKMEQDKSIEDVLDNSCPAKLVKIIPDYYRDAIGNTVVPYRVCPIVPAPAGSERGKDFYLGIIHNTDTHRLLTKTPDGLSLKPRDLWDKYHRQYAEWVGRKRMVMTSVALRLSAAELSALRMSEPVYFLGRRWIVRRLEYTLTQRSGDISAVGEFISMD